MKLQGTENKSLTNLKKWIEPVKNCDVGGIWKITVKKYQRNFVTET